MARKRIDPATRGKVIVGVDTIGRPIWKAPVNPAAKIKANTTVASNGCHIWTRAKNNRGYGHTAINGRRVYVHRLAFELAVGPIPEGMEIDHVCHTQDQSCPGGIACLHRACCNPEHLEPVTSAENSRRAGSRLAHCSQGHEYTAENTVIHKKGQRSARECRTCNSARGRIARAEESRLRTHCAKGHELTPDNIATRRDGVRWCRQCREDFSAGQRGEKNRTARLRDGDAAKILARLAAGDLQREVAAAFGVSRRTISRIHRAAQGVGA